MPSAMPVKKVHLKSQGTASKPSSVPTPNSSGRMGTTWHNTPLGWSEHQLGKRWVELCEKYAGNGEEQSGIRFDWAHNGKKANGWIELLSDKDQTVLTFQGSGWGSGRGTWKAHGEDLEVTFGSGRHILSLDETGDRWVMKAKYQAKTGKAVSNAGTAGWPTAKGDFKMQAMSAARQRQQKIPLEDSNKAARKETTVRKTTNSNKKVAKSKSRQDASELHIGTTEDPESEMLVIHEGEGGFLEAPVVPGAKHPCRMHWGLVVPGLVSATLIIPPESWNEKETLAPNRTIMFYVLRGGEDGKLCASLDDRDQYIQRGDSFCVHPETTWVITNESKEHEGALKMVLLSTDNRE